MHDPFPAPPAFLSNLIRPLANSLTLTTLPLHIHEILFSWAGYHLIHTRLSPLLSTWLFPKTYPQLPPRSKINWDVRIVSFVQACVINSAALYVIVNDVQRGEMDWRGRIWGYGGAGGMVQGLAAGYFLWDVAVSARYFKILGPGSLAHAVSALLVTTLGFRPFANYYGLNFVLYALSTPFLNLHWFFDKLGLTGSRVQLYNGITLLTTFFCARVLWGNYQSARIYSDVWTAMQVPEVEVPLSNGSSVFGYLRGPESSGNAVGGAVKVTLPMWLVILYLGSNTLLNFLNIYWFGKMIQTVWSRFQPAEKKKPEKDGVKDE